MKACYFFPTSLAVGACDLNVCYDPRLLKECIDYLAREPSRRFCGEPVDSEMVDKRLQALDGQKHQSTDRSRPRCEESHPTVICTT